MEKSFIVLSVIVSMLLSILAGCQTPHRDGPNLRGGGSARGSGEARSGLTAPSGRKLALVIGNSDYTEDGARLENAGHDADDMARVLAGLDFEVVGGKAQKNLGLDDMNTAVREFGDRLGPGVIGVFYFAGHGMQVKGKNYLIPIASGIQREDEVPYRAFDANQVLAKMDSARNGLNLMILDACRNNPFERSFRSGTVGLAPMDAPAGTLIAYAAKPGMKSKDSDGGQNGLYTGTLLKYLTTPGLKVEEMLKKVRVDVKAASSQEQQTWEEGGLESDFCFAGCVAEAKPIPPVAQREEVPVTPPKPAPYTPPPAPAPVVRPQPVPEPPKPVVQPTCTYCPEMVRLPGGSFMMGSSSAEPDNQADEKPRHSVQVGGFAIGKYEVTQAQYAAFVDETGDKGGGDCYTWNGSQWERQPGADWRNPGFTQGGSHPVVCVNVQDAEAYARWLSQKTGRRYRLPTEVEWEYAARAGTEMAWFWGDDPDQACGYANVADQTAKQKYTNWRIHNCSDGYVYTAPVGSFSPNGLGLYDMLGNVWEWTCSAYTGGGYDGSEKVCTNNAGSRRAIRGGSWIGIPGDVRSANRGWTGPTNRNGSQGFRLAQD